MARLVQVLPGDGIPRYERRLARCADYFAGARATLGPPIAPEEIIQNRRARPAVGIRKEDPLASRFGSSDVPRVVRGGLGGSVYHPNAATGSCPGQNAAGGVVDREQLVLICRRNRFEGIEELKRRSFIALERHDDADPGSHGTAHGVGFTSQTRRFLEARWWS